VEHHRRDSHCLWSQTDRLSLLQDYRSFEFERLWGHGSTGLLGPESRYLSNGSSLGLIEHIIDADRRRKVRYPIVAGGPRAKLLVAVVGDEQHRIDG